MNSMCILDIATSVSVGDACVCVCVCFNVQSISPGISPHLEMTGYCYTFVTDSYEQCVYFGYCYFRSDMWGAPWNRCSKKVSLPCRRGDAGSSATRSMPIHRKTKIWYLAIQKSWYISIPNKLYIDRLDCLPNTILHCKVNSFHRSLLWWKYGENPLYIEWWRHHIIKHELTILGLQ